MVVSAADGSKDIIGIGQEIKKSVEGEASHKRVFLCLTHIFLSGTQSENIQWISLKKKNFFFWALTQ